MVIRDVFYPCPDGAHVETMFYRQCSALPHPLVIFQTSVSHCEVSTCICFMGFTMINHGRQCCRQGQLLRGCWLPSPVGTSAEADGLGMHIHTGQRAGFEAFTVCFGGGDTPEKTVVKGECMFPGQRLAPMHFLSVTPESFKPCRRFLMEPFIPIKGFSEY